MEPPTALRCYNVFDDIDNTGYLCGGIRTAQPVQAQFPYCSNPYPNTYDSPNFSGMSEVPAASTLNDSVAAEFYDLDMYSDRQQRFNQITNQQRRESFSSSTSSLTGSPPPTQDPYVHMPPQAFVANDTSYSNGSGGTSRERPGTAVTSNGGLPIRRQNRKERQLQMEREERELTATNAELRRILWKLQRQYEFLESRVKSSISQAAQPAQGILQYQAAVWVAFHKRSR